MKKSVVDTFFILLKKGLITSEMTKEFDDTGGLVTPSFTRYDFRYSLNQHWDIVFTIFYEGDFKNRHKFSLDCYFKHLKTNDFLLCDKESMDSYIKAETFPASNTYELYLSFLNHIKCTFQSYHAIRLYMITYKNAFINKIEHKEVDIMLQKHREEIQ